MIDRGNAVWLGVGAGLIVLGLALGRAAENRRGTPRPPPGPETFLGGLSALGAQASWIRADAAARRGDVEEALLHLDAVSRLEPQMTGGADHVAGLIGGTMAGDEPDPARRVGLALQGLAVLDRAVDANPGDARPLTNRARYLMRRLSNDAERARAFAEARGEPVELAALRDCEAALRAGRPRRGEPLNAQGDALRDLDALDWGALAAFFGGIGRLRDGAPDEAARLAARAAELHARSLAVYEARGLGAAGTESKRFALAASRGLADALSAPETERAARYRAYHAEFGGETGVPALPPPPE